MRTGDITNCLVVGISVGINCLISGGIIICANVSSGARTRLREWPFMLRVACERRFSSLKRASRYLQLAAQRLGLSYRHDGIGSDLNG